MVKIPKDLVLSVRSCSLAGLISVVPYGLEAQLCLSLALYVEMSVRVLYDFFYRKDDHLILG